PLVKLYWSASRRPSRLVDADSQPLLDVPVVMPGPRPYLNHARLTVGQPADSLARLAVGVKASDACDQRPSLLDLPNDLNPDVVGIPDVPQAAAGGLPIKHCGQELRAANALAVPGLVFGVARLEHGGVRLAQLAAA